MSDLRPRKENDQNKNLRHIFYLSGFLDLLGVSMIMPLIQPQIIDMGASPTVAGILGSVYGGLQLFSSPVVGHWSDSAGRRYCLYMCLLLTAVGYTTLGLYQALSIFFIGRFVLGCFKHSQTICKALLADSVSPEYQAEVIGNFNSFSSIGFIVGPICGGHLAETQWGFSLVAFTAGFVFLLNSAVVWWVVPPDTQVTHHEDSAEGPLHRSDTSFSLKKLNSDEINFSFDKLIKSFREFDWVQLWDLFLIKFLAGFSVIIFRTNFSMVLRQKFVASPKTMGYMTSYSGIVSTLSGFVVGKITRRYNNTARLFLHVTILQAVALLCLSLTPSITLLICFLTPLGLVTSVSRVSGTTLTIQRSGNTALGSVMGLSQSVMAIARMIAPFLAGLAQEISVDGASYISVVAAALSVAIMVVRPQDPVSRKLKTS
ncbi:major facilitator superfamily domain-containing protein 9 [Aplysia californica]|uniref:Major facilitator superfamily domain-containing protein 9 n=1 Tax=Aplysia californica TaxID=6500 RepID=A0ABM0JUZ3_APLCA|nr:major facilitator superfamily domain-containing protein 9 [Aplysia californica]